MYSICPSDSRNETNTLAVSRRTRNRKRATFCPKRATFIVCFLLSAFICVHLRPVSSAEPPREKLLIAFASYRDRPNHSNVYFYEHDGVGNGKIVGTVGGAPQRAVSDTYTHPSLSADGRLCAYTHEVENNIGRIALWDNKDQKNLDLGDINKSPNAQMGSSLAGNLIAFSAWARPDGPSPRWHVFAFDRMAKKLVDLPGLNTQAGDERMPALSGDGKFLAYIAGGGVGRTDVFLYDRTAGKVLPMTEMNSKATDTEPSLSGDGRLVAFSSDRPGGKGGRDIYLFDRQEKKFLPLPGLNTVGQETMPALSQDGRFIVFVSERVGGEGQRDIYLYDCQLKRLVPTPGLNSKSEDFDPCVVAIKGGS